MKKLFFLHVWLNLTRIAEKEQVENIHLFCFLYLMYILYKFMRVSSIFYFKNY